jgi:MFS superfamily sulfate permease-like transporter
MKSYFKEIKSDLPASIIVFFVALPLCLGIALASGAPLFAGIIAGIVGGVVVGAASGSPLGVSGPAAGLAVIVAGAITSLGSWQAFLTAVVIAGIFQIILGFARAGVIAYFFPNSVIKGMLTGIGLLIIIKQVPHALGALNGNPMTTAAVVISVLSLALLILWDQVLTKKSKIFQILQGPIVVVGIGILFTYLSGQQILTLSLDPKLIVSLPIVNNFSDFLSFLTYPDFSQLTNPAVYKVAAVLAIVASLETLLCVEATDKLDPYKRVTPANRELKAQGLGNLFSGLIGGLPVTQVVVRSSANIAFGGKTKVSSILHGCFLLMSVLTISSLLNMIPLASLATILIMVGYKLAKPALFKDMYKLGWEQFIPFMTTIAVMIFTDLLLGISIGMMTGLLFTLYHNFKNSHDIKSLTDDKTQTQTHYITLAEEVSFFNKVGIIKILESIPENSKVVIDYSKTKVLSHDVLEFIKKYSEDAILKKIEVQTITKKAI